MKKLLINLSLALLLNALISAAPSNCNNITKASTVSMMEVGAGNDIGISPEPEFEIHPLDILSIKFN